MKNPRSSVSFILVFAFISIMAIESNAQVADFEADITDTCGVLVPVRFYSKSTGSNLTYTWVVSKNNLPPGSPPEIQKSDLPDSAGFTLGPGTYDVSLTVKNANGSDEEVKSSYIKIYALPNPDFNVLPLTGCTPFKVTFSDNTTDPGAGPAVKWEWVLSNGASFTGNDATYEFTQPGTYDVSLTVTNQFRCARTAEKLDIIVAEGPEVNFTTDKEEYCLFPANVIFTNQSTGNGQLTHEWDFGDGKTRVSSNDSIHHEYSVASQYEATLTVTDGAKCVASMTKVIPIGGSGGADFILPAQVCVNQQFSLSEIITGTLISLSWDFGDNTGSGNSNPAKTYAEEGTYKVILRAQIAGNECESRVEKIISVVADPDPGFTFTTSCLKEASFVNTSTNATRYRWDFGDGTSSQVVAPKHVYATPGTYLVTLSAFNSMECSKNFQVIVNIPASPIAAFSPSAEQDCLSPSLSGCVPFELSLTNLSTSSAPIESVEWDFGDGDTSTESHPVKLYDEAGEFDLKLTITDENGCSTSKTARVTASDTYPVASFELSDTLVCAFEDVIFTSTSDDATTECWFFGDESFGTGESVEHNYANPAKYSITLVARNGGCTDTLEMKDVIRVQGPSPLFNILKSCEDPYTLGLESLSSGETSFVWDFGDGAVDSTNLILTHTYAETGKYTVSLWATSTETDCELEVETEVFIQDIKADFTVDKFNPCLGETVTFTDKSEFAVFWEYSFSNGTFTNSNSPTVLFPAPGTYNATLRVKDLNECEDTLKLSPPIKVLDIVGNMAILSSTSYCDSLSVHFDGIATANPAITDWLWDFGDGGESILENPVYAYQEPGLYNVALTLTNPEGSCTISRNEFVSFTIPIPDFLVSKAAFCEKETITFVNKSSFANYYWWEFGNGNSSFEQNPAASYNAPGLYDVTLHARDNFDCLVSTTRKEFINVTRPTADFVSIDSVGACPPFVASFQDQSINAVSWIWDFGNGNSGTIQAPKSTYSRPGVYDVTLTVKDVNGCLDSKTHIGAVNVQGPDGIISAEPTLACVGDVIFYRASTTNTVKYLWDFKDGTLFETADSTASHTYTAGGTYNVIAIFADENGCEVPAQYAVPVVISENPKVSFTYSPEYPFDDETVTIQSEIEHASQIIWMLGDSVISSEENPSFVFATGGPKELLLRGVNEAGCSTDTLRMIQVQASIFKIPNVFTPDGSRSLNDYFEIPGVELGSWELLVYNRYGVVVYESDQYASTWNADNVPPGIYYYTLQNIRRKEKFYKGWVSIVKGK